MKNNNQRTWIIIGVIVAIVVLFFIFRKNNDEKMEYGDNKNTSTEQSATSSSEKKATSSTEKMETGEFTIEGTLQASDNSALGNIKIVGTDKTTYLITKQDYSSLYGKQVVLKAYGTSSKFTFESLTEKK